jgi:hypothetical protein
MINTERTMILGQKVLVSRQKVQLNGSNRVHLIITVQFIMTLVSDDCQVMERDIWFEK